MTAIPLRRDFDAAALRTIAKKTDLYLRRHLPQARQGRGARPARLQHLRDESTSCRDRQERRPGRACGSRRRPRRLAHNGQAGHTAKHHPRAFAGEVPRTQSGGECLAVLARQLAVEPRLQVLRRYRRPLLRRMEQAYMRRVKGAVFRATFFGAPIDGVCIHGMSPIA
jgi:hypothetical protein